MLITRTNSGILDQNLAFIVKYTKSNKKVSDIVCFEPKKDLQSTPVTTESERSHSPFQVMNIASPLLFLALLKHYIKEWELHIPEKTILYLFAGHFAYTALTDNKLFLPSNMKKDVKPKNETLYEDKSGRIDLSENHHITRLHSI